MHTPFDLPHLPLDEALRVAEEAQAWEALDETLRGRVLRYLQAHEGELEPLQAALARAGRAAGGRWRDRWYYLMDLVRDAPRSPSLARPAAALARDQWAGRVLAYVAERPPRARKDIAAAFPELGESHLSNLLADLESAGVVARSRAGRETTVLLTPAGRDAVRQWPTRSEVEGPRPGGGPRSNWHLDDRDLGEIN